MLYRCQLKERSRSGCYLTKRTQRSSGIKVSDSGGGPELDIEGNLGYWVSMINQEETEVLSTPSLGSKFVRTIEVLTYRSDVEL